MKKRWIPLFFSLLLLFPYRALGDCADLERFTNWLLEDEHTVIFYRGEIPLAKIDIRSCELLPSSTIRLINSYVCDSDDILVDDKVCGIMTVKVLY